MAISTRLFPRAEPIHALPSFDTCDECSIRIGPEYHEREGTRVAGRLLCSQCHASYKRQHRTDGELADLRRQLQETRDTLARVVAYVSSPNPSHVPPQALQPEVTPASARQFVRQLTAELGLRSERSIPDALQSSPRFLDWRRAHDRALQDGTCDPATHRTLAGCARALAVLAERQEDGRTLYVHVMSS